MIVSRSAHHRRRGERAPWRALLLLTATSHPLDPAIDLLLDVVEARFPERIGAMRHAESPVHPLPLRAPDCDRARTRRPVANVSLLTFGSSAARAGVVRFDDLRRLVPETLGDLLVPLLHLIVRHVDLASRVW